MTTIDPAVNSQDIEEALKNCEREAIHQVGHIQPYGIFLALDDAGLLISHVSENIKSCFPYSPSELLGKPFSILVGAQQAESIREVIGLEDWRRSAITTFTLEVNGSMQTLDAQISRSGDLWIVEMRIPVQTGHAFHGKLDSHSRANWTLIPRQTGQ